MKIKIHYICGINGDRVEVSGIENGKTIWKKEFSYGYNASSNRRNAKYAEEDYYKSLEYGWNSAYYCLKPYIGDILTDILAEYGMTKDDAEYSAYFAFPQMEATKEELRDIVKKLYAEM